MNTLGMVLSSSTASGSGSGSTMFIVVYILIFVAIIYFMMIRPQKKQKAKTEEMHNQMEPTQLSLLSLVITRTVVFQCIRMQLLSLKRRMQQ